MNHILIPRPIKPGLSHEIQLKAEKALNKLMSHTEVEVAYDSTKFSPEYPEENFFARLARMRNYMIDTYLQPYHTEVLWIDADVIEFPADLYDQLRGVAEGVIAPMVLIEGTEDNYDTAGMRESYERRSGSTPPYFEQPGPVVPLQSVGGCVLVPADIHRKHRFYAQPDDEENWVTEWWSICQAAGGATLDTRVRVFHANLPDYGENWH